MGINAKKRKGAKPAEGHEIANRNPDEIADNNGKFFLIILFSLKTIAMQSQTNVVHLFTDCTLGS